MIPLDVEGIINRTMILETIVNLLIKRYQHPLFYRLDLNADKLSGRQSKIFALFGSHVT